jgi:FMN phosphatase YigB (HAD superfamily)
MRFIVGGECLPVRAVIFDLFDTLIDLPMDSLPRVTVAGNTFPSTVGALHEAFAVVHPIDFDAFAAALRGIDREWRASHWERGRELSTDDRFARLLAQIGVPHDAALVAKLTSVHMGLLADLARMPPHHAALLDRLRGRVKLGLCSNFSHAPTARALLEASGLDQRLDAIVISHEHGLRKPRAEIFESTLAALGVGADEAIHVGDNLDADVAGAAAVGLRTVWITRCVPDADRKLARHPGPPPTWQIADLADLERLLAPPSPRS